jgi:hypothetical protein
MRSIFQILALVL